MAVNQLELVVVKSSDETITIELIRWGEIVCYVEPVDVSEPAEACEQQWAS